MSSLIDFIAAPVPAVACRYQVRSEGAEPRIIEVTISTTTHPQNAMAYLSAIAQAEETGPAVTDIAFVPPGADSADGEPFYRSRMQMHGGDMNPRMQGPSDFTARQIAPVRAQ